MDDLTLRYLKHALCDDGEFKLEASTEYNDVGLNWDDPALLTQRRKYEPNEGWHWDGVGDGEGITWGGCLESIDELLRHGIAIPSLAEFENVILFVETSEEIPSPEYVFRVFRALGERGILERLSGLLVGRPKAWEFSRQTSPEEQAAYKAEQRKVILEAFRTYNPSAPVVQNLDLGHTAPQICLPMGRQVRIDGEGKQIFARF
jgi:muramoyltetrapeptide carboxypeptidase LdcA involved in peptidoglycan recycling